MTRVAAIDCGTNSIRLLIADRDDAGGLRDSVRRTEIVRLGQGVDVTGRIAPEAMRRTLAQAGEYAAQCREHDVVAARFVATSASRDASNADEFVEGVRAAFGDLDVSPEVVSGDEEASLSFAGATGDVVAAGVPAPYLVVDLGGVRTLIGLAGSITTVTADALDLPRYDAARIHGARLSIEQASASCTALLEATRAERAAMPFMHPGRVDVIGAGALVWRRVVERVAARAGVTETVTSETDILDGIALSVRLPSAHR